MGNPVPTPFYRWGPNLVWWSRPSVYTYRPNFIWMWLLCRLPLAKNHNFGQISTFWGLLYRPPFIDEGQIWFARADRRSTLSCEISSECVHCVGFRWPKTTILGKFRLFGGSCTFYQWGTNVVCYSRPTVYTYVPNFFSISLFCRPLLAKIPNFCRFLDFGI